MNDEEERLKLKSKKEECQRLITLVEDIMDFKRHGFHQSFVDEATPKAIYDSIWCRVMFVSQGLNDPIRIGDEISIYYGRLHASDDSNILLWNGKSCYCWHRINEALLFLDGLSPQEALEQSKASRQLPRVMEQFRESELGASLRYRQPEWLARMHITIWEYYGQRLFELFDLRNATHWEEYEVFFRDVYRLKPYLVGSSPTPDNIC